MLRSILTAAAVTACLPASAVKSGSSGETAATRSVPVATTSEQGGARGPVEPTDGVPATSFPTEVAGLEFGAPAERVIELCREGGGTAYRARDEVSCTFPAASQRSFQLEFPVHRLLARLCTGTVCAVRLDAPAQDRRRISELLVQRYGAAAAVPMGASESCEPRSSGRWRWRDEGSIGLDECRGSVIVVFAQERAGDVFVAGY